MRNPGNVLVVRLDSAGDVAGLDPAVTRFVPHHVAHAASTALTAPFRRRGDGVTRGASRYRGPRH